MAYKIHQNTFQKGLIRDTDKRVQDPSSYNLAENMSLTGENDFYALKNMKGTTFLDDVISLDADGEVNVLASAECDGKYLVGTYPGQTQDEVNRSIIFFTVHKQNAAASETSSIWLRDVVRNETQLVYQDTAGEDNLNFPLNGTIDLEVFGEENLSNVYWIDFVNELREFEIIFDPLNPITSAVEFCRIRRAPIDTLSFNDVIDNEGQLSSGTYNISYQYFNTVTKKESTWSLFTGSIPIYPPSFNTENREEIYGGVPGEQTSKAIELSIDKKPDNSFLYDSIKLAVIKNIGGLKTPALTAFITTANKDFFDNPSSILYTGAGNEIEVDISEIVVDDAPIETFKTLSIKEAVLFGGNIKYRDRLVENVTFSNAETVRKPIGTGGGNVYQPSLDNTNNPTLNFTTSSNVLSGTDERFVWVFKENVAQRSGSPGIGCTNVNSTGGLNVYPDNNPGGSIFEIGNDVVPGNTFRVRIQLFGGALGFEKCVIVNEFGFSPLLLSPGSNPSPPGLDLINFTYTALEGDTDIDVTDALFDQLLEAQVTFPNTLLVNRISDTSIEVINVSPIQTPPFQPDFFDAVYLGLEVQKGIDISINQFDFGENDGGYKNPKNCVERKGYFRDEVYRFGITYMDKFGTWSPPVPFDFTDFKALDQLSQKSFNSVTFSPIPGCMQFNFIGDFFASELRIGDFMVIPGGTYEGVRMIKDFSEDGSGTKVDLQALDLGSFAGLAFTTKGAQFSFAKEGIDWKFPNRENPQYNLFNQDGGPTGPGQIEALGLKIEGITNHPEWAKAFAIVRTKRINNILYQGMHVPTYGVQRLP